MGSRRISSGTASVGKEAWAYPIRCTVRVVTAWGTWRAKVPSGDVRVKARAAETETAARGRPVTASTTREDTDGGTDWAHRGDGVPARRTEARMTTLAHGPMNGLDDCMGNAPLELVQRTSLPAGEAGRAKRR